MALLNSISSANRVVEQGNTYQFYVEPAVTTTGVAVEPSGGGNKYYDKVTVQQWKGEVTFSKRYRYDGLTESAARTECAGIVAAYTKTFAKWAVGIQTFGSGTSARVLYCYVEVGSGAKTLCASVTPVHGDGPMWSIEVDVNVTAEKYSSPSTSSSTPPTDEELMALVSGISDFPEGGGGAG